MPNSLSIPRRKAFRLAYLNALLWALGNGLVSATLIRYWASDCLPASFSSRALAISLIIASPRFLGVLRLFAPVLIGWIHSRRRFCVLAYSASSVTLVLLPILAAPGRLSSPTATIAVLITLWGVYHLLEYLGTISLWSWLGDLVPRQILGRFIGYRERWLLVGRIVGALASVGFVSAWNQNLPANDPGRLTAYAISAAAGATLLLLAVLPLMWMPSVGRTASHSLVQVLQAIRGAFLDRSYRRFLVYNCWTSTVNGLTSTAQFLYPKEVLGITYYEYLALDNSLRLGQSVASPSIGKLIDRIGNRPVLIISQLLVATGPLFFLLATPNMRWILAGAYLVWIAYVGLNIGLPKLMLDLSPTKENPPHISLYFALGGLFNGLGIVAGGLLLDAIGLSVKNRFAPADAYVIYAWIFAVAVLARGLSAWLLARVFRGQTNPT